MNFSDRFFLQHLRSLEVVGIYAVGYKFGFMLNYLVVQPFCAMWEPRRYFIFEQPNHPAVFSQIFTLYAFLLTFVWSRTRQVSSMARPLPSISMPRCSRPTPLVFGARPEATRIRSQSSIEPVSRWRRAPSRPPWALMARAFNRRSIPSRSRTSARRLAMLGSSGPSRPGASTSVT